VACLGLVFRKLDKEVFNVLGALTLVNVLSSSLVDDGKNVVPCKKPSEDIL